MNDRAVCVHGHFYQPPRENPWLEAIELQDSAYPYHDWNERIAAECYAPNARSRIVDDEGFILRMVSNYERMSFNFGPTLLAWMERSTPEVYEQVLAADTRGAERFGGHGPAIAQAYGHVIMPLASAGDKETQVRWGVADFRQRFGRDPEGMWLPETGVDLETLDVMARNGISFTILEPHQAAAIASLENEEWTDVVGGQIDPRMPYLVELPEGRSIAVFFYDGPVSQAIAFEALLADGNRYADRLLGLLGDGAGPQIAHVATDGETYGHHQRHGDMALAWALERIDQDPDVDLTIYGEWLERHPPTHRVRIVENTAWSCVHGVDRWRSDCGCSSGMHAGWHQRWRAPLRDALDWLRSEVDQLFEKEAKAVFEDPWEARNSYIDVVLDRSPDTVDRFLQAQRLAGTEDQSPVPALRLMELQRHAMLMYTSCGWFFDELSGIETVQVILYAGRVLQLAKDGFGVDHEPEFVERLSEAESNIPDVGDGRTVYERFVKPAQVSLPDVGAHYALTSLFEEVPEESRVRAFDVTRHDRQQADSGRWRLATGRITVSSRVTRESADLIYGVLHFGDHNLTGGVRRARSPRRYQELVDRVFEPFQRADLPATLRELDRVFSRMSYTLAGLFRDERRRIVSQIIESSVDDVGEQALSLYEDRAPLLRFLGSIGVPIPDELSSLARTALGHELATRLSDPDLDQEAVARLLDDAEQLAVELDREGLGFELAHTIEEALAELEADPTALVHLERLAGLVDLAGSGRLDPDLTEARNRFYDLKESAFHDIAGRTSGRARRWEAGFRELAAALKVRVD